MTISDGQTITQADLRTAEGSRRATINAARSAVVREHIDCFAQSLSSSASVSRFFTPQDNCALIGLYLHVDGAAASVNLTVTLSVATGETEFLMNDTVALTQYSGAGGTVEAAQDESDTSQTRYVLRRGVPYEITVSSSGAASTLVQGTVILERRRRVR